LDNTVHILNVVDGCIPSDIGTGTSEEIEEERRLLCVAMTRAKDHLHLIVPQRFYVHSQAVDGDRHVYASGTRFVPESIAGPFESCVCRRLGIDATMVRSRHPMPGRPSMSRRGFARYGAEPSLAGCSRQTRGGLSPIIHSPAGRPNR
jgi:hypothetical protein